MIIGLYRYDLPFKNPIHFPNSILTSRSGLIIRKNDGWGEICPLPEFSIETLDEAKDEALTYLEHIKNGRTYIPELPSVQFGVDCMNANFEYSYENLEKFPTNYSLLLGNPKEITLNWLKLFDNYPKIIKLKVGRASMKEELKMLKEICKKTPDVRIILDPNCRWSKEEALSIMKLIDPKNIEYIEDPCNNLDDAEYVSKNTGIPIALDELARKCAISDWSNFSYLKAIILKPSLVGGFDVCSAIKEQAKLFDIKIVASSSFESQLGNYNIRMFAMNELSNSDFHGLDTNKYFKYSIFYKNKISINTNLLSTIYEYED